MQSWAIVVGINQYPERAKQKKLEGAVADARDFAEWALDPAGGNVDPTRLFFWAYPWPQIDPGRLKQYVDDNPPHWFAPEGANPLLPVNRARAPSAGEIVRTAEMQGDAVRAARLENPDFDGARIFVFLAGHGLRTTIYKDDVRQTCFLCGDFRADDMNIAGGLIPCESFRRSLRNNRFDEVFCFLDCCRTEPSTLTLKASPLCDLTGDRELPGWSTGHAAPDLGRAYETEGNPVRGAFSQTLMDGLRGHRGSGNRLDAPLLDAYVKANIGICTKMPQKPYFEFEPHDPAPVLVVGPPTMTLANVDGPTVRLAALQPGEVLELVTGGNDEPIWTGGPYAEGTAEVKLPPLAKGLYGLRVVGEPAREQLFRHPGTEVVDVKAA